ncbi:MAG TPA: IgGFc-binding protein, partial [Candidatus Kapabacteria bacterium]|nr:IgGFc-binding protein [Candidatus Kapabacteria bacterium]
MPAFHAGLFAKTYIHKPSAVGNDYYIVFPKAAYGNQNVEALVNSAATQNIIVTKPGGSQKDTFALSAPNTVQVINSMFHVEDKSEVLDTHGAARIQSSSPISVIGQFGTTGISGTYNALPVTAWGTEYYVLNEPEGENSGYTGYYPRVFSIPQVTIIASQNGTKIDITLPSQVHTAQNKSGTFTITLNAGDVYYFTDAADPNAVNHTEQACVADFTGARIVSEDPLKPIGVIVSQSHTSEPCGDNECGDFGMEWLPPISAWDTAYIITTSVPHGGNNPGQGELLRVTFAYDNTTLYKEDANGRTSMGTYNAGEPLFIGNPIIEPYVLSADRPFLTCEITTKPQSCLVGNKGGNANFTFSMVFMPGVDEWSDFTPFCTADQAAFSQANIYFRQADEKKLYVNGVPLLLLSPVVNKIPGTPYSYLTTPLGSNIYYEIRGDSGATAGGTLFGYGEGRFSANNGNGNTHTLDPEMVKSFAHPIGINNIPVESPDSLPPVMTVAQSSGCGKWFITVSDSTTAETLNTGIYSILLAENNAPDSSFNVQFHAIPSFQYGSQSVTFEIDVRNLASSAAAALHIRDGAGNELDTTLFYDGLVVSATPQLLDAGVTRDAFNGTILLQNASNVPVSFFELKLQSGKYWKIVPPTPVVSDSTPLTFKPGESNTVHVMFSAPVSAIY